MCINKNEELLPYYEKAKELLDYNLDTGVFSWKVNRGGVKAGSQAGSYNKDGYVQLKINYQKLSAHRLAWFFVHNELPNVIDHINGVRDDNRIENLRSCTHTENQRNVGKRSDNTSGYKGVSWHKQNSKWQAKININGKTKHLGSFTCSKEASEVYEAKARELFGEFYINNN